jgi:hypothetical protein
MFSNHFPDLIHAYGMVSGVGPLIRCQAKNVSPWDRAAPYQSSLPFRMVNILSNSGHGRRIRALHHRWLLTLATLL